MNMRHFNFPTEAEIAEQDAHGLMRGIINSIIPAIFGWLVIFGMGYVAWCLLP